MNFNKENVMEEDGRDGYAEGMNGTNDTKGHLLYCFQFIDAKGTIVEYRLYSEGKLECNNGTANWLEETDVDALIGYIEVLK